MPRAAFVYTDEYVSYHLSDTHPLQQKRLLMTQRLLAAYGAFDNPMSDLIPPAPTTRDALLRVHTPEYLDAMQTLSRGETIPDRRRYGFGADTPPFPGMWEASLLYAGASLDCARLVMHGGYDAAFNTSGGLHHAQRGRAAGFCTVNDCALVAYYLLDHGAKRVAYVDIDAHHGDGVQAIFYDDPRVLTLSIHETPDSLFPRVTGRAGEIGQGAGTGFNANLPMLAGSGDRAYAHAFDMAFLPLLRTYDPEFVLLQVGTDAHFSDRLAHLNLTASGWLHLAEGVIGLGRPIIALGGGGYNLRTVARLWTLLYGALSEQEFPAKVPQIYCDTWGITHLPDQDAPDIPADVELRAQDCAAQSVQTIRDRVFPFHGL